VVQVLRGLMDASQAPRDDRWEDRYRDIPRSVSSAGRKLKAEQEAEEAAQSQPGPASPPPPPTPPVVPTISAGPQPTPQSPIEECLDTFKRWLLLPDMSPVLAVLGAVAANLLPGDPVWLGLVAPPSSAKTEILNSLTSLPNIVQAATLTPAGLLSGTPS